MAVEWFSCGWLPRIYIASTPIHDQSGLPDQPLSVLLGLIPRLPVPWLPGSAKYQGYHTDQIDILSVITSPASSKSCKFQLVSRLRDSIPVLSRSVSTSVTRSIQYHGCQIQPVPGLPIPGVTKTTLATTVEY